MLGFFSPLTHDEIRSASCKVPKGVCAKILCQRKDLHRKISISQAGRRERALTTNIICSLFCFSISICLLVARFNCLIFLLREHFLSHPSKELESLCPREEQLEPWAWRRLGASLFLISGNEILVHLHEEGPVQKYTLSSGVSWIQLAGCIHLRFRAFL